MFFQGNKINIYFHARFGAAPIRNIYFHARFGLALLRKTYFRPKKTCVWEVFLGQKYGFLKTCCTKSVMELVFHTNYVQYQHLKPVLCA